MSAALDSHLAFCRKDATGHDLRRQIYHFRNCLKLPRRPVGVSPLDSGPPDSKEFEPRRLADRMIPWATGSPTAEIRFHNSLERRKNWPGTKNCSNDVYKRAVRCLSRWPGAFRFHSPRSSLPYTHKGVVRYSVPSPKACAMLVRERLPVLSVAPISADLRLNILLAEEI